MWNLLQLETLLHTFDTKIEMITLSGNLNYLKQCSIGAFSFVWFCLKSLNMDMKGVTSLFCP